MTIRKISHVTTTILVLSALAAFSVERSASANSTSVSRNEYMAPQTGGSTGVYGSSGTTSKENLNVGSELKPLGATGALFISGSGKGTIFVAPVVAGGNILSGVLPLTRVIAVWTPDGSILLSSGQIIASSTVREGGLTINSAGQVIFDRSSQLGKQMQQKPKLMSDGSILLPSGQSIPAEAVNASKLSILPNGLIVAKPQSVPVTSTSGISAVAYIIGASGASGGIALPTRQSDGSILFPDGMKITSAQFNNLVGYTVPAGGGKSGIVLPTRMPDGTIVFPNGSTTTVQQLSGTAYPVSTGGNAGVALPTRQPDGTIIFPDGSTGTAETLNGVGYTVPRGGSSGPSILSVSGIVDSTTKFVQSGLTVVGNAASSAYRAVTKGLFSLGM